MMQFSRRLLSVASAAVLAGLAACGEDTVEPSGNPPAVPTGLAAAVVGPTRIDVTWSVVTGATGYRLERADATAPGVFAQVGGSLAAPQFDDNAVTAGGTYSYRVAAINANGTSAFSSR